MSFSKMILSAVFCATLLFSLAPADLKAASNRGVARNFSWINEWGSILPDTIIPSNRFNIKADFTRLATQCAIHTNYEGFATYSVDYDGDGRGEIVVDGAGMFGGGFSRTCPQQLCSPTYGCPVALYDHLAFSQIFVQPPSQAPTQIFQSMPYGAPPCPNRAEDNTTCRPECKATYSRCPRLFTSAPPPPVCPANPADNTSCRAECAAVPSICPQLFEYNATLIRNVHAFDWRFITTEAFATIRATINPLTGKSKYREPLNRNPIFDAHMGSHNCTLEEMDLNNNGTLESGEICRKYFQYSDGLFVDLYQPQPLLRAKEEKDWRITSVPFDRTVARVQKINNDTAMGSECIPDPAAGDQWRCDGFGLKAGTMAYQLAEFQPKKGEELGPSAPAQPPVPLVCKEVTNSTPAKNLFVPTRTDLEIDAFNKVVAAGNIAGVSIRDCRRRFTSWVGRTACPTMRCGETLTIAAERKCQRASSAYGECEECAGIADPSPIRGFEKQCFFSRVCRGNPCRPFFGGGGGNGRGGSGDACLSPDATVLMADGSHKRIDQVQLHDIVLGTDAGAPLGQLRPKKVIGISMTEDQSVVRINGLGASSLHEFVGLHSTVTTEGVKVGQELVGVSGEIVPVTSVVPEQGFMKVYNLVLEDGGSYIAQGMRVMGRASPIAQKQ